jgi:hypothetical protein
VFRPKARLRILPGHAYWYPLLILILTIAICLGTQQPWRIRNFDRDGTVAAFGVVVLEFGRPLCFAGMDVDGDRGNSWQLRVLAPVSADIASDRGGKQSLRAALCRISQ